MKGWYPVHRHAERARAYHKLAALSTLQNLNLQNNYLQADDAAALGPYLVAISSLQNLDRSANYIHADGAAALVTHLAAILSQRSPVLTCLEADGTARAFPLSFPMKFDTAGNTCHGRAGTIG
jgi:hypothetical protein